MSGQKPGTSKQSKVTAPEALVVENRKVRFDYEILSTYEAGLVLQGSEVKSIRNKEIQLKDAYITFKGDEAFLQNMHIGVYRASSYNNHEPERLRKVLLHRNELDRIYASIREKGLSCVPLRVYFKKGRAKVELALVRGKKAHDKRQDIKKRDVDREMRQVKKSSGLRD